MAKEPNLGMTKKYILDPGTGEACNCEECMKLQVFHHLELRNKSTGAMLLWIKNQNSQRAAAKLTNIDYRDKTYYLYRMELRRRGIRTPP